VSSKEWRGVKKGASEQLPAPLLMCRWGTKTSRRRLGYPIKKGVDRD